MSHTFEHIVPLADGTSLFFPHFCRDLGINADALYEAAVDMPWIERDQPFMRYRGNVLKRQLFFVHVNQRGENTLPKYPGFQYETMQHYVDTKDTRTAFITYLSKCLSDVFGFHANHVIGTQYSTASDFIGPHSDRPSDLCPRSWIVSISLGDQRDFVLKERTPEEQECWLEKNDVSGEDPYVNFLGRTHERITLTHGSAVLLSTTTNSRWTHEVLPAGPMPIYDSRISLVFRDIQTLVEKTQIEKRITSSQQQKQCRLEAKNMAMRLA